jgi:hypothetical protein
MNPHSSENVFVKNAPSNQSSTRIKLPSLENADSTALSARTSSAACANVKDRENATLSLQQQSGVVEVLSSIHRTDRRLGKKVTWRLVQLKPA